jgi:hypothetical protein
MPIQQGCTQAAPKKQHIAKTSAATLNKSKKRKRVFLFLDLLSAVVVVCRAPVAKSQT